VGRENDLVELQEARVELWLSFKDIQSRSPDLPALEGIGEGRIVHYSASRDIDEAGGRLHLSEVHSRDNVMGLRGVGEHDDKKIAFS